MRTPIGERTRRRRAPTQDRYQRLAVSGLKNLKETGDWMISWGVLWPQHPSRFPVSLCSLAFPIRQPLSANRQYHCVLTYFPIAALIDFTTALPRTA